MPTTRAHRGGCNGAPWFPEQVSAAPGTGAPGVPSAGEPAELSATSDRRGRRGGGGVRTAERRASGACRGPGGVLLGDITHPQCCGPRDCPSSAREV